MHVWAIAVPHADPSIPQSKPYTNSTSSTTLSTLASTITTSGEVRSETPRRKPWPPSARKNDGMPIETIRRYVSA